MRKIITVSIVTALTLGVLALCGCSTTNISKLVSAMGKDTNSLVVEITTIYGKVVVYRNVPYRLSVTP